MRGNDPVTEDVRHRGSGTESTEGWYSPCPPPTPDLFPFGSRRGEGETEPVIRGVVDRRDTEVEVFCLGTLRLRGT